MKYQIVEAHSARELQSKVQEYIDQGWEPLGGLSVATHGPLERWYYQALTKSSPVRSYGKPA